MATTGHTDDSCGNCSEKATFTCGVCQNIKYCSTDCEQEDKPVHSLLCTNFRDLEARPGPDYRRAILLPESSSTPRFIWIKMDVSTPSSGPDEEDEHEYEDDSDETGYGIPSSDTKRGEALPNMTGVLYPEAQAYQNELIPLVVGTRGNGMHLDHTIHMLAD